MCVVSSFRESGGAVEVTCVMLNQSLSLSLSPSLSLSLFLYLSLTSSLSLSTLFSIPFSFPPSHSIISHTFLSFSYMYTITQIIQLHYKNLPRMLPSHIHINLNLAFLYPGNMLFILGLIPTVSPPKNQKHKPHLKMLLVTESTNNYS